MATELRGLYAITPDEPVRARLLSQVEAALSGGCRLLQYRDKVSAVPERVARAHALRDLTRRFGAKLIINDDLLLTTLVDADGLHLGSDDGDLALARRLIGPQRLLGASCYADFSLAENALAAGVDYVAFGAAYPSSTKPNAVRAPKELFSRTKTTLTAPAVAIGGITLENAPPLIAAGASLLAVITDLFSAPDIAARAAAYQRLFDTQESH